MSIPSKVVGAANNSTARNVFKVTFSQNTTNIPTLRAWDDYTFSTTANEVFAGTTGNGSLSMIGAIATTPGLTAPASDWMPTSPTAGGAQANRLKGSTNYVNLDSAAIDIGVRAYVTFNLNWEIPSDAAIPADMALVFVINFTYSGAAPVLTWAFNDSVGGGTEGTPVWTSMTPGVAGNKIKPADAGVTYPSIIIHRPLSGVVDSGEVWVVAS